MRCFIHTGREGVAVCLKCGKGMCMSCSGTDEHSGVCPNCIRSHTQNELNRNRRRRNSALARFIVFFVLFLLSAASAVVYLLGTILPAPLIDLSIWTALIPFVWIHFIILGFNGFIAFIFFILALVAIIQRAPTGREIARLEKRITTLNMSISQEENSPLNMNTVL